MINSTTIEVKHRFLGKTLNPLRSKQNHTLVKADNKQQQEKATKSKEVKTLVFRKNKIKPYNRSLANMGQTNRNLHYTESNIFIKPKRTFSRLLRISIDCKCCKLKKKT